MATYDSDSDESFKSFHSDDDDPSTSSTSTRNRTNSKPASTPTSKPPAKAQVERFSPEEEATLLAESNSIKGNGNQLFGAGSYQNALQTYDRALASCPNYLDFELAVLRSNVAACHLKLEEWKEAVTSAEKGLDCLERLEPLPRLPRKKPASGAEAKPRGGSDDHQATSGGAEEVVEEVDDEVADRIESLRKSGRTLDEVRKLQIKLLMRRAKARTELGGWAALQGAEEDYQVLGTPTMLPVLSATDKRTVMEAAKRLGPRLNAAKETEMAEMMDKLKGLGNSILKPFGLSTENFQFVKDQKTGGYSMNFDQKGGAK